MANDPKSDLEQGKRDTEGRPVVKAEKEQKKEDEQKEKSGQPKDPE